MWAQDLVCSNTLKFKESTLNNLNLRNILQEKAKKLYEADKAANDGLAKNLPYTIFNDGIYYKVKRGGPSSCKYKSPKTEKVYYGEDYLVIVQPEQVITELF